MKADEHVAEFEALVAQQIEQLRQSLDEGDVQKMLETTLHTLDDIENSYRSFHDDMVAIARDHVIQLEKLFQEYSDRCCTLLGVSPDNGTTYVVQFVCVWTNCLDNKLRSPLQQYNQQKHHLLS